MISMPSFPGLNPLLAPKVCMIRFRLHQMFMVIGSIIFALTLSVIPRYLHVLTVPACCWNLLVILMKILPGENTIQDSVVTKAQKAPVKKSISRARDSRLRDQPEPPTHSFRSIFANERVRLDVAVEELKLCKGGWHLRETIRIFYSLKNIRQIYEIT